jgi:hypothetical protein
MSTENATSLVYQRVQKAISKRVRDALPEVPENTLAQLSLSSLLNLLFVLRGEYGSVGDFIGTSKALRAVVGDRMFWEDPKEQSVAPAADLVQ